MSRAKFNAARTLTTGNSPLHMHLLLIHGFPLNASCWNEQVTGLADVANVIAPDLRGFGSDGREVPEVMTMEAYAEDLKALLDERNIERAVLCGLSMGGYIAMAFLERWPERVQGLILANTRAGADDAEAREGREQTAKQALEKGMDVLARGMAPKLISPTARKERPELYQALVAVIATNSAKATAAAARGMAQREDRSEWLRTQPVPALVITSEGDELMALETSEAMAEALPNGRLVVIPQAGHLSNVERPQEFNRAVRDFLLAL